MTLLIQHGLTQYDGKRRVDTNRSSSSKEQPSHSHWSSLAVQGLRSTLGSKTWRQCSLHCFVDRCGMHALICFLWTELSAAGQPGKRGTYQVIEPLFTSWLSRASSSFDHPSRLEAGRPPVGNADATGGTSTFTVTAGSISRSLRRQFQPSGRPDPSPGPSFASRTAGPPLARSSTRGTRLLRAPSRYRLSSRF